MTPRREEAETSLPICITCGYNLTGLTSERCPECGWRIDSIRPARAEFTRNQVRRNSGIAVTIVEYGPAANPGKVNCKLSAKGVNMYSTVKARWMSVLSAVAVALILGVPRGAGAQQGAPIPLPDEDRKALEKYLGAGVVGKAVAAKPLTDPLKWVPLENTTWSYRMISGDQKGQIVDHKFSRLERDPSGATWKVEIGNTDILFMRKTDSNDVEFVSHPELDTGLVTAYQPPAPLLVHDMKPGQSRKKQFDVKVYYMNEPEKVKHSGSLELTLTYVGAYEVTTPAGKFEAALIKSDYKGKVGPAKVDDVQYRLFVEGVGVVAMIEDKSVSAYLLYKDYTKIGKVLEKIPQQVATHRVP